MRASRTEPPARTKVVATIGPASSGPRLPQLLDAGVDVCRLNFSHGELQDHAAALAGIRQWAARHDSPVAVLGDLCGPKIRLNRLAGDRFELTPGQSVRFVRGDAEGTPERLTVSYPHFIDEVEVGSRIYIDDGLVRCLVTDRSADALTCTVTAGGVVSNRKGVNLPDTRLSIAALTEKDRRDASWALEHELDYLALSFVRQPDDLRQLQALLPSRPRPGVIVKIEMVEALEHLDELVALSDGVMVARGDLGVQMDVWQVPLVQKAITRRCREAGKPVIIATQMLQSMMEHPMPTRAEVSDVANAILDSADAVMLSGESASGRYPVQAVEMMRRVARAAEAFPGGSPIPEAGGNVFVANPVASAIAHAAVHAARHVSARLVAVWTATGETARLIAQHRLPIPVVALSADEGVLRRLSLVYGLVPLRIEPVRNPAEMGRTLDARLAEHNLARPGDLVVVVTSTKPSMPGTTDVTLIHQVGK
jgi:pyruvate kinase